jgi:RsiW-degrading membrane proteinase PrsW (M82 family)
MTLSKSHKQTTMKALLAIIMLAALAGVAGSQIAPHVPLQTVLLYCLIGAAILLSVLVFAAIVTLTFNQFILRHGGTDPTWFWFKSEPPGLERQRVQLKDQKK